MPDQMVLRLDDLRDALDRALRATQARLGAEVVLQDDYYWHLPVEQAFDVHQEPGDLTMGQLSDDLAAVSPAEESGPHSAWHELAHLVGLLRALERLAKQ